MQFPPELLNQIAVALEVAVACVTALLVAFWIGMVIWTFRDIRARTRDIFAWLLATLLVLVTGPIGLLLYLLLRPRETLAQAYDRQLEEEALLREITMRRACPSCQYVTEAEWLICPHCGAELRRTCKACGRPLELDWKACPFCTTPVERTPRKARDAASPVSPIEREPASGALAPQAAQVSEHAEPTEAFLPAEGAALDVEPPMASEQEPEQELPAEDAGLRVATATLTESQPQIDTP